MWNELPNRLKHSDREYFTSIERIRDSHRRCEQLGLPRDILYAQGLLDTRKIEEQQNFPNELVTFSRLLFASTFGYLPDKRVLLILTDAYARIISIHSSPVVIRAAAEKGMCLEGASVAENSNGTTAVSLALDNLEPAILWGEQHYSRISHDWYCVAIPIIDAQGSPMGCFVMSTDHEATLGEKFALASSLAKELGIFAMHYPHPTFGSDRKPIDVDRDHAIVQLTERQGQVLELFSQGESYKQIARHLQLQSVKTVQEHLDAVRTKLGAINRRNCIRKAIELGLLN